MTAQKTRKGRSKGGSDERILAALAIGATAQAAAREAGVSTRTVERRLADPAFKARLHQLRGETLERTGAALLAATLRSVQTLLALQDAGQPGAVRLGAAKAVVELTLRVREAGEIERRLAALEAQAERGLDGEVGGNHDTGAIG